MREHCYYCSYHFGVVSLKTTEQEVFDEIDISLIKYEIWKTREIEENRLIVERRREKTMSLTREEIQANPNMNEKEKKFAIFFASEKTLVSEMNDFELKAHIEELQSIAFEARARLTASADEAQERQAKKKRDKGFAANVEKDDFTSEAISNIAERQKKMTKVEKEIQRLVDMGISREDAENMYKASTILVVKNKGTAPIIEDIEKKKLAESLVAGVLGSEEKKEEKKPFSNPFASAQVEVKEELKNYQKVEIVNTPETIENLNHPNLGKAIVEKKQEETKPTFVNPFGKK